MKVKAPVVETTYGKVVGVESNGHYSYRGIRYAKPPVGELRFAPPQPPEAWEGIYDATEYRTIAMQTPNPRVIRAFHDWGAAPKPQESEDCLFLNVTTPGLEGKRPVMVYIHGGANLNGYSYDPVSDPTYLINKGDIVHVGIDFRTGIFGFLYHPALVEETLNTSDKVIALKWIHNNIAAFGGDPDNITVIGISSGAHNIVDLIAHPSVKGLVHNAIIQSASFGRGCFSRARAIAKAERIFSMLDVNPANGNVRGQLAAYSAQELKEITFEYATNYERAEDWGYQWGAVHDECEEPAASAMINGFRAAKNGMHIIVGHTENEAGSFRPYQPEYGPPETERVFSKHLYIYAKAVNAAGGQAWAYNFGWCPKGSKFKACHCIDQPFTYGTCHVVKDSKIMSGAEPNQTEKLTEVFSDNILSMVRYGHPADTAWERCTSEKAAYRYFDGVDNPMCIKE